MEKIRNYTPNKYNDQRYQQVEENIYKTLKDSDTYVAIKDEELINTLKSSNDWVGTDREKNMQYNGKEYKMKTNPFDGTIMIMTKKEPEEIYVTSLVFEPEPELGENEPTDKIISQYPLEDILDKFGCWCSDLYEEENESDPNNSYQEFASNKIENIRNLKRIIGKHVYNKEEDGQIKLIIE